MPPETQSRIRITEYLDLDIDREEWMCNRCGRVLGPARESYKKGCLMHDRDPREIHPPSDFGGLQLFSRSALGPHRRMLLPRLRHADRNRIPAARATPSRTTSKSIWIA